MWHGITNRCPLKSCQNDCNLLPIFITAWNAELPGKVSEKRLYFLLPYKFTDHLNSISTLRTPALKQCLLSAVVGHQVPCVKYVLWSLIVENHLLAIRIGSITILDLCSNVGRQNPDSEWRHLPPFFVGGWWVNLMSSLYFSCQWSLTVAMHYNLLRNL